MKLIHRLQASVAILASLLAVGGCEDGARRAKTLRVGMELAYSPFEMMGSDGRPSGVSVDLASDLARALERRLEIVNLPFDGLIPALKSGGVDVVISSLTATPERERAIAFSKPYLRTGLCILAGRDAPIQRAGDLDRPGHRVAVKRGTTGALHARERLSRATVLVLDKENACVLEVAQRKADAFLYDQMSVYRHWRANPETTRAILEPIHAESWAIGLRHGDDALRARVDGFLDRYRAGGGFDRLGDRHLAEIKAAFRERGIAFVF